MDRSIGNSEQSSVLQHGWKDHTHTHARTHIKTHETNQRKKKICVLKAVATANTFDDISNRCEEVTKKWMIFNGICYQITNRKKKKFLRTKCEQTVNTGPRKIVCDLCDVFNLSSNYVMTRCSRSMLLMMFLLRDPFHRKKLSARTVIFISSVRAIILSHSLSLSSSVACTLM